MTPPVPPDAYDVLLFEHIPKTAGSTFRRVLWQQYGSAHEVHTSMNDPEPRTEQIRAAIRAGRTLRALTSHVGYGLHERLPDHLRFAHVTILRDPVDRAVSHYYYARSRGNVGEDTTLLDFCRPGLSRPNALRAWNTQTAYLSGLRLRQLHGHPFDPTEYDEALLDQAKANLDRFAAVGLLERFDESLLLLGRTFGWPLVTLRSLPRNVGRRPPRAALSDEEREALEAANRLDRALYRYATERFEALLEERVPDAPERLRSLSRLNQAYRSMAPAVKGLEAVKRTVRRVLRAR